MAISSGVNGRQKQEEAADTVRAILVSFQDVLGDDLKGGKRKKRFLVNWKRGKPCYLAVESFAAL